MRKVNTLQKGSELAIDSELQEIIDRLAVTVGDELGDILDIYINKLNGTAFIKTADALYMV